MPYVLFQLSLESRHISKSTGCHINPYGGIDCACHETRLDGHVKVMKETLTVTLLVKCLDELGLYTINILLMFTRK